jgi:uncharacterized membrane protein
VYGLVRAFFFGFILVLVGMCIGGDGHQAAAVVSGLFGWAFRYPVFTAVLIVGIIVGRWIGRERAVDHLGEYEKAGIRRAIETSGDRFK